MYCICINVNVKSKGYMHTYCRRYAFNIIFNVVVILTKDWKLCHFGEGSVSWLVILISIINISSWINIILKLVRNNRPNTETLCRSGEVSMFLFWWYKNGYNINFKVTISIICLQITNEVAGESSIVVLCHSGEGSTLRLSPAHYYHNINKLNHTNNTNTHKKTTVHDRVSLSLMCGQNFRYYNHSNNNG